RGSALARDPSQARRHERPARVPMGSRRPDGRDPAVARSGIRWSRPAAPDGPDRDQPRAAAPAAHREQRATQLHLPAPAGSRAGRRAAQGGAVEGNDHAPDVPADLPERRLSFTGRAPSRLAPAREGRGAVPGGAVIASDVLHCWTTAVGKLTVRPLLAEE